MSRKVRDVLKRLRQDGWIEVRQSGSHKQFRHPTKPGLITVAFHSMNDDIPLGTYRNIAKVAGWEKD